jgi:hypothetical protein
MSALLTSQQSFTLLKGRLRLAGKLPGNGDHFPSDKLKPVSAEMAARPITPEERSRRRQRGKRR